MGASKTGLFAQWLGGNLVIADQLFSTGKRIFVHSGTGTDAGGYGYSPDKPVATLDYAVGLCTANKGDVIVAMPEHAENLATAIAAVIDIAGVRVVGLGEGLLRPTFSFTAAAGTVSVTAANCVLENLRFVANFATGTTIGITVGADADGLCIRNCEFADKSAANEFLIGVSFAAGVTDAKVEGCRFVGAAGTLSSFIYAAGAVDRFQLLSNVFHGDASAAMVDLSVAASVDVVIQNNLVINVDTTAGLGIAVHASSTGFADGNKVVNLKDTVVGLTGAGLSFGLNYYSNAVNASSRLAPAADS